MHINRTIKNIIKRIPYLYDIYNDLIVKYECLIHGDDIFTHIYKTNRWGNEESLSRPGSSFQQTQPLLRQLPALFNQFNVSSILDIPCGDFHWMQNMDFTGMQYMGADIVQEIIEANQVYTKNNIIFKKLNITKDILPSVDLIFVRDCFVHFSYRDLFKALHNCCNSKSHYLLMTTFIKRDKNKDIFTGQWRPLNFQIPPFNFPDPIGIINEEHSEKKWGDKSLGLWKITDIKKSLVSNDT